MTGDPLLQRHRKQEIEQLFDPPFVTLYRHYQNKDGPCMQYSALISKSIVSDVLSRPDFDLRIGAHKPSYATSSGSLYYEHFSSLDIQPIVLVRDRTDNNVEILEIIEEFRLFHDLYTDQGRGGLVTIDDAGDADLVVKIEEGNVEARKPYLAKFLAAKQMYLALYFDFRDYAPFDPSTGSGCYPREEVAVADRVWHRFVSAQESRSVAVLYGKRLWAPPMPPTPDEIWVTSRAFEDFIVGYDSDGHPRLHNPDPGRLAEPGDAAPGAPHYLTPVHFRREVLGRYYADPSKFDVADGRVSCKRFWGMDIDNNRDDRVIVFLGDLGQLPHKEQLYWKSYNIAPENSMSEVAICRAFYSEFADGTAPDLAFKEHYKRFQETWQTTFGWALFRPLSAADSHILAQIHVPLSENPAEFDRQVLYLAKLMIDSLNDEELTKNLGETVKHEEKSLRKLEKFLDKMCYKYSNRDIEMLRSLQHIRSTGAAHRKGKSFDRILKQKGYPEKGWIEIAADLLSSLSMMLADMRTQIIDYSPRRSE